MNEMRVCIESLPTVSEEIRSAWFTLPIDADVFEERLQVSMDSEDYRIIEKELPFADEVKEDTIAGHLNNLYTLFTELPSDLQEDCEELLCFYTSLEELHTQRNDIIHYPLCKNMTDVARTVLEQSPAYNMLSETIIRYFGFEGYGQYLDDNGKFVETDHGIYELP